jgi:outer membrane protein OmpA-like peptidoglycan-associated protein
MLQRADCCSWPADVPTVHRSIGSLSCTCVFVHDNLRDACQLRWLAEVRGLDPWQIGSIGCVEHLEIAEAMGGLETSISFQYGSLELEDEALPSIQRVSDMLRRHQGLSISIEAHCGLEAQARFAEHFTRRRAMAVRRALEKCAGDEGGEALSGRIHTRAWGNSRPVVWAHGEDPGAANRRVELYLQHGSLEIPKRRPLAAYARPPGVDAPSEEADTVEAEAEAVTGATFDADEDVEDEADWGYGARQNIMVQLPDGRQVVMPLNMLHQLQMMDQPDAMELLTQLLEMQLGGTDDEADDQQSDEEDNEDDQDSPSVDIADNQPPSEPESEQ